ncbi:MAG: hypothetical protein IJS08_19685, partial [Victivallales bacterium]|nr:hypothetical protein [Victivallales bacterium]
MKSETIAKPFSQTLSQRDAMASSPRDGVVTTPRFRPSHSLAAFWQLGGNFAIASSVKCYICFLCVSLYVLASEQWFFLPNFHQDIRGIEQILDAKKPFPFGRITQIREGTAFYESLPDAQRKELYWHPVSFPDRNFVKIMPQKNVYGWYGCEFEIPETLSGMDVLLDLGIIDDTDRTYLNGQLVGATGEIPRKSAWQTVRYYRLSRKFLRTAQNTLAVQVW